MLGLATVNWCWFGKTPSGKLAKEGKCSCSPLWLQKAYRWFHDRLPSSLKEKFHSPREVSPVGPPSRFVPFPACIQESSEKNRELFDMGVLAFLSVDSNGSPDAGNTRDRNDSVHRLAYEAARYVYDLFRKLQPQIGYPNVEIAAPDADGGSLALSAMIAAACRILKVPCPDDIVATGCFQDRKLQPVCEDTLWQKTAASVRYGYRKFFIVTGQKGTWKGQSFTPDKLLEILQEEGVLPKDAPFEFIEIPTNPLEAIFRILRELPEGAEDETAMLLAVFEKVYLRSDLSHEHDIILDVLSPFTQSSSVLVRHVALDILCRRELHLGNTPQADKYRRETPCLSPSKFPFGLLGYYLKYEETASKAILDLDLGYWSPEHPDHQQMERILERLKGNINDKVADIEEIRNALALANTRGRRLMFLGRLNEDPELLEQAWGEFTAFQPYWKEIFEYAGKYDLSDNTFRRQWNQCMECLADYWNLTRKILRCPGFSMEEPLEGKSGYDLISKLQSWVIQKSPETISLEEFLRDADAHYEDWKRYPNFLPYEKVLIYGLGTDADREHAQKQLARAEHLLDASRRRGIFALLGMRTAFVLKDMELLNRIYDEIAADNPLKKIADKLMEEPEKIGFRCPY